ncbi:MAG: ABC-2 family transporter protein [Clostridia bacterium]|nr:ABC-2 family transporter protein [Clostridia bacterium]
MKTLRYYIRIYFMIASQYIKVKMQYRADFYIGSMGMIFSNLLGVFSFWVLFHSISQIKGWSFDELIFIYGYSLLSLIPLQLFFDHIWYLKDHLIRGTFLKYYFKPLNMMFYYMSEILDLKGLSQLVIGIGALIYASVKIGITWSAYKIALLLLTLFSSSLSMISLTVMTGATGFWILNSQSFLIFINRFRDYARYPITIFNKFFRVIFTYVLPVGFIAYYPSQIFLRPSEISFVVFLSPIIGILFFALAYFVWCKGVNSYSGTGS